MVEITQEEIDATLRSFEGFTEAEIQKFMRSFQKKQEPLLVYIAAVAEREELNEHEYDVFITMALMTWDVMRNRFPKLKKIGMKQLEVLDDNLFENLQTDTASMLMVVEDYSQPELLRTILTHVMESEPEVREEKKGTIYLTLKNVVDGLIQASDLS